MEPKSFERRLAEARDNIRRMRPTHPTPSLLSVCDDILDMLKEQQEELRKLRQAVNRVQDDGK